MTPHDVRLLLAEWLPVRSVAPLGSGLDHRAYAINGDLVARVADGPDAAEAVQRDAAILAALPGHATLPTPQPVLVRPEHGLLVYRLLPGVALLERPDRSGYADTLGAFLARLHAAPADLLGELAGVDDTPPREWLDETRELAGRLPDEVRRLVAEFLDTDPPAPADDLVFTHNDLGAEHILTVGGEITGVIDWTDCAVADPAADLGRLVRDLGLPALDELRPGLDHRTRERVLFYARCTTVEDLAFGLETGRDPYTLNARRALGRLFDRDR
ncbi:aminoglycoside phosphotransferase (APT) family kinase protein [Allocatelliglobosispora scoriae]|uniref:Aminoglycoside phosphotransferase (APT) family kinase protein n=1 Tax=Allocatelliglobosispora scoriae TaxID=643052 RepID=A0A841BCR1_9ACTN|nr:phosphotransferase [Allocatelliglobosispora scoriae]MBB5866897.1 aminoglycoside phosphotransferase (APT) family kinase protein [Allocatelliglobosispora scoriae]